MRVSTWVGAGSGLSLGPSCLSRVPSVPRRPPLHNPARSKVTVRVAYSVTARDADNTSQTGPLLPLLDDYDEGLEQHQGQQQDFSGTAHAMEPFIDTTCDELQGDAIFDQVMHNMGLLIRGAQAWHTLPPKMVAQRQDCVCWQVSTLLSALLESRVAYASPAAVMQAACRINHMYRTVTEAMSANKFAESTFRKCVESGLSLYLLRAPAHICHFDDKSIGLLVESMRRCSEPATFYQVLWGQARQSMHKFWSVDESLAAVQATWQQAELSCMPPSRPATETLPTAAASSSSQPPGALETSRGRRLRSHLAPSVVYASSSLQELWHQLHTDLFDAAGVRLKEQFLGNVDVGMALNSHIGQDAFLPTLSPSLILASGLRYPNAAQQMLQLVLEYNAHCQDTLLYQHRYVCSSLWLDTLTYAAAAPLQMMLITCSEILSLLKTMAELKASSAWEARPAVISCLDEALAVVALPGASLDVLVQLYCHRAMLTDSPPSDALCAAVNEAVLTQCGQVVLTEAQDMARLSSSMQAQLEQLCALLEVAARWSSSQGWSSDRAGAADSWAGGSAAGGVDVAVLFNKIFVCLAIAHDSLWESPAFLSSTYPRLMTTSLHFRQRPGDLLVDRYIAAISTQIKLRSAFCWSVDSLEGVLQAVSSVPDLVDPQLQQEVQKQCGRVLVVGVANHFIRTDVWLRICSQLVHLGWPCPQLVSALGHALVEEPPLFSKEARAEAWLMAAKLARNTAEAGARAPSKAASLRGSSMLRVSTFTNESDLAVVAQVVVQGGLPDPQDAPEQQVCIPQRSVEEWELLLKARGMVPV